MTDDIGLAFERIRALQSVTFPVAHPHKRFAWQMGSAQRETITPAQVRHVTYLAWRYRRQMPAHLVPPADPYAVDPMPAPPDAAPAMPSEMPEQPDLEPDLFSRSRPTP
ncbi:hypothetical protein [Xanthobacter sp.]|uniref:hypothetical protein n=1 Tax=Xanthobacter sp. TaxID=35809 RepID=UPI0025F6BB39|nr:hypothetical protein [Xanthobacter sp.]